MRLDYVLAKAGSGLWRVTYAGVEPDILRATTKVTSRACATASAASRLL